MNPYIILTRAVAHLYNEETLWVNPHELYSWGVRNAASIITESMIALKEEHDAAFHDFQTPKVFRMNDCDWVAAYTLDEAKKHYLTEWYYVAEDEAFNEGEPPSQVTEKQMNSLKFHDEDLDFPCTFHEQLDKLIARGAKFPSFFASTEY